MNELSLEPFAAQIDWQLSIELSVSAWCDLFGAFLLQLARDSRQQGYTVIGHIKGFSHFNKKSFVYVSVVHADHPPTSKISAHSTTVSDHAQLTLNMLVYGLAYRNAETIVQNCARSLAREQHGQVTVVQSSNRQHHPPSHHQGPGHKHE